MHNGTMVTALSIGLAIALGIAAFTDWKRREIDNELNAAIALAAPLFWWAGGLSLWPGVALQFALALGTLIVLGGLFALRAIGGGDVKLLVALALWLPGFLFLRLLIITALAGGVISLAMLIAHHLSRRTDSPEVPYGIAIAFAGLWVLAATTAFT